MSRRQRSDHLVMALLVTILGVCVAAHAAGERGLPGQTYESIRALPDWSGWWQLNDEEWKKSRVALPLKPEVLAGMGIASASIDFSADPLIFCRPQQFVGFNSRFAPSVEFLFTPGRVTITNEGGLIRRIYTDGRALPAEFDESSTGTSIGHWEGPTLVIETAGISPNARYPGPDPGAVPIGRNVRITEHIRLRDPNTLQIDVETVAPDILTGSDRRTILYRHSNKKWPQEVIFCVDKDRDFDAVTGKQRFDLTPPADLPPLPPK